MSWVEYSGEMDTIAAVATPSGRGSVGIIRISGPRAPDIAIALLGHLPEPRNAVLGGFKAQDGSLIDQGLVLYFPGPNSFTGESVVELQGHGGPWVLDALLKRVLTLGARLARPGEFSERAFLNGKIDLSQAEAIADLIGAESAHAARAAVRSLQGEFSRQIQNMVDALIELRMYLDAAIDFADEAIDFLSSECIEQKLTEILAKIAHIKKTARQGALLQEGLRIAILGPPNAGKSSLLNTLSGQDTAIVTDIAGTTRDVIREKIHLEGLPIQLIDTAGLRETSDQIEKEGIRRSLAEIEKADFILWLVDGYQIPDQPSAWCEHIKAWPLIEQAAARLTFIRNKIDLNQQEDARITQYQQWDIIHLSLKEQKGLSLLTNYLKEKCGFISGSEALFSARRRHLDALIHAEKALERGLKNVSQHATPELLAEDLRAAQHYLGEITGEFTTEDLLGKIFSEFCIGK